jgi:hypothetical protein
MVVLTWVCLHWVCLGWGFNVGVFTLGVLGLGVLGLGVLALGVLGLGVLAFGWVWRSYLFGNTVLFFLIPTDAHTNGCTYEWMHTGRRGRKRVLQPVRPVQRLARILLPFRVPPVFLQRGVHGEAPTVVLAVACWSYRSRDGVYVVSAWCLGVGACTKQPSAAPAAFSTDAPPQQEPRECTDIQCRPR